MFSKQDKIANVIIKNYHLLPVVSRFGQHIGFGDMTIEQYCQKFSINADFFLAVINTFSAEEYFPEEELQNFDIQTIIKYLKETHKFFLEYRLKKVNTLLNQLIEKCCKEKINKIISVKNFFKKFTKDFLNHIEYEDKELFPYALKIEEKAKNKEKFEQAQLQISNYYDQHSNVEASLEDFIQIFIKYFPETADANLSFELIEMLSDFRKELEMHQKIEEKVLLPKIKEYEILLKNLKNG